MSARGFIRAFLCASVIDPASGTLVDLRQDYIRRFSGRDFTDPLLRPTMTYINARVDRNGKGVFTIRWDNFRPSSQEDICLSRDIAEAAQESYGQRRYRKLPRWVLRFALHSLSLDPPPPASVIIDCLVIIAIDLGCKISVITTLDESACVEQVSSLILQKLEINRTWFRKATSALIPYAIRLAQSGKPEMIEEMTHVGAHSLAKFAKFGWHRVTPYFETFFNESNPPSINLFVALISPWIDWRKVEPVVATKCAVTLSRLPYTDVIGRSVVDTLLHLATLDSLRSHIPLDLWMWLKKRPSLPPVCFGRDWAPHDDIIPYIRGLGDIELLKSYFLVVWSEWNHDIHWRGGVAEMEMSVRQDFGGVGMWREREELLGRLNYVLGELERELGHFKQVKERMISQRDINRVKDMYRGLRGTLMEVDRQAREILARPRSTFTCALPLPFP